MMNILMVLNARSIGGVETHVITLSEELSSRGHKVIVVSSNRLLGDILSNIGIKHYLASVYITTSLEDIKNILKYLYSFMFLFTLIRTENIEIVHVHGPSSSAILSFGVAKISKRALVYTHHVSYVKGLHFSALKVMGNHFDSIIAISGEIKDYLIKNINIIPYKIDIIYNGIKLDDYKNELPIFSKDIKRLYIFRG
jgi:phosphatidylinositol glycan class A protein